ncbi:DUF6441 family protein [Salipiger marinus]|uniref:Uncharacterized protein n=1 Tax=Salipiger marinus TaxID=555512 RepID=A0A1G8VC28_9RHOB|nr:DUF6441 family protein [Salipiger marinus]SDJ63509.1 hypothetical protein SAMN04487993_10863 [Salipiger marinus]
MRGPRLEAALQGDLRRYLEEELDLAKRAVTKGVHKQATVLKHALRADVIAGGLGRRLARSWQQENYPKGNVSLNAASYVFSKAEKLVAAFEEGATIRASKTRFLAIPTPAAPKSGRKGVRLTPSNFPEDQFGPLRFVYVKGGTSLLVVDNQRERRGKRGGYALSRSKRALASGHGLLTVPMFFLVPQVRLRRRLNVQAVVTSVTAGLAREIDAAFQSQGPRRRRRR